VRVVWLDSSSGALAMRVDLYVKVDRTEESVPVLLEPGHTQETVDLPISSGTPLRYRYEVRRLDEEGETLVAEASGTSSLLVVRSGI
jgi:hypothetical protein